MCAKIDPAILRAYGITQKDADEIEEVVKELIAKHNKRSKVISGLKKRYSGNKLLYAAGFAEFAAGYIKGLKDGTALATTEVIVLQDNQQGDARWLS